MKIKVTETVIEADARELRESNTLAQNFISALNRAFRSIEPFDDDETESDKTESDETEGDEE